MEDRTRRLPNAQRDRHLNNDVVGYGNGHVCLCVLVRSWEQVPTGGVQSGILRFRFGIIGIWAWCRRWMVEND